MPLFHYGYADSTSAPASTQSLTGKRQVENFDGLYQASKILTLWIGHWRRYDGRAETSPSRSSLQTAIATANDQITRHHMVDALASVEQLIRPGDRRLQL